MAELAVELWVGCAAAVAQICHAEVDDERAATGGMVEIMSNFNISTLTAPAGSYFELVLTTWQTVLRRQARRSTVQS